VKCLYQASKVSCHIFLCQRYRFCLFLHFLIWFWNCSDCVVFFCFSFHLLLFMIFKDSLMSYLSAALIYCTKSFRDYAENNFHLYNSNEKKKKIKNRSNIFIEKYIRKSKNLFVKRWSASTCVKNETSKTKLINFSALIKFYWLHVKQLKEITN
jgi:hypothetical protein